jgi:hypothetical protein
MGYYIQSQIWEYKMISAINPGEELTQYVMIADFGTGWLMVHNLSDNESEQLSMNNP